jgi:hypothetical protein
MEGEGSAFPLQNRATRSAHTLWRPAPRTPLPTTLMASRVALAELTADLENAAGAVEAWAAAVARRAAATAAAHTATMADLQGGWRGARRERGESGRGGGGRTARRAASLMRRAPSLPPSPSRRPARAPRRD